MAARGKEHPAEGLLQTDVLDAIQEGIWIADKNHRIVFFNTAMERISGVRAEAVIGVDVTTDFARETTKQFLPFYRTAADTLQPIKFEAPVVTPTGRETIQSGWFIPRIQRGRFNGMICTIQDITEARRAIAQLAESEERIRSIAEQMSEMLFLTDDQGIIVYVSPASTDIFGFSPDEMEGKPLTQFIHESDAERASSAFQAAVASGIPSSRLQLRMRHSRGEQFIGEITARAFQNSDGHGTIGVIRDVSIQQKAEDQRNRAAREWEKTFDAVNDGMWILDAKQRIVQCNRAAEQLFQLSRHEQLGQACWTIVHGTSGPIDDCPILRARKSSRRESMELRLEDRWFLVIADPILDKQGDYTGAVHIIRDMTEQKQAQERLEEREENYRLLFENMLNGFALHEIVLDSQGAPIDYVFLEVNDAFERLTGLSREALIGKAVSEAIPGTDRDPANWIGVYGRVALTGKEERFEQYSEAIGKWFSVLAFSPRRGQFATIFEDITARQAATEALRKSQQFNEALLNMSPDVIYVYDLIEQANVYSNEGLVRVLGYPVEEIQAMGRNMLSRLMHPEDYDIYRNETVHRYAKAQDGDVIAHDYRMKHKDGTWRWLHSRESVFNRLSDQSPRQIFGLVSDITERRNAEQSLQDERDRAQQYLDIAGVIFLALSVDGTIVLINQRGSDILGYSQQELIGKNWFNTFVPAEMRDDTTRVFERLIEGKTDLAEYHENPVLIRSGEQRTIAWHNTLLRDVDGAIIGTLSSGEDITKRLSAEQEKLQMEVQLRQSQKLESIGTLASGVAHEINNPLMGMINYAELVKDRVSGDPRSSEMLKEIIDEGGRIAMIVKNLLSFARQDEAEHSPARIEDILEATLTLLRATLRRDQITLQVNLERNLPVLHCRSQQIRQVLVNLITNAQAALNERFPEYHEEKILSISVSTHSQQDSEWIRIAVKDHGPGIPDDIQDRIYDPFFTSKSRDQGSGLGLSVSHGIVREHGGRMWFETREGEFTRFYVDLPVDGALTEDAE